jgi:hypothetical protein
LIDRALSRLGWQPSIDLEYGLKETVGYFCLKVFAPAQAAELRPIVLAKARRTSGLGTGQPVGAN